MNRKKNIVGRLLSPLVAVVVLCMLTTGCSVDDACLSYQHNVQTGFYSAKSAKHVDTTLTDVVIYGLGREDSLLYDVASAGKLFLNLNLNQNETGYVIQTKTLKDTVLFWYTKELSTISGNCGITFDIRIDSMAFTNTFIDSVSIIYPYLRYKENSENVKIFIY
jgi:hypothetical protein